MAPFNHPDVTPNPIGIQAPQVQFEPIPNPAVDQEVVTPPVEISCWARYRKTIMYTAIAILLCVIASLILSIYYIKIGEAHVACEKAIEQRNCELVTQQKYKEIFRQLRQAEILLRSTDFKNCLPEQVADLYRKTLHLLDQI